MESSPPETPAFGNCPFCGHTFYGRPNQCRRCGTLLHEAAEDTQRLIDEGRQRVRRQKGRSDTFFLVGLLLGGPMMTVGGGFRLGLFIVLGGALASVIRRYSDWSNTGTVIVGAAFALVLATSVIEVPQTEEESRAAEAARAAYVAALAEADSDVFVETRGIGHVAVWFTVPQDDEHECGQYPPEEVREHLAELGFRRVVVTVPNESGGVCTFAP